jgi:hypothetical protein
MHQHRAGRFSYSPATGPTGRPAILDTCTGTLWVLPMKSGESWRRYSLTEGTVDENTAEWQSGADVERTLKPIF